MNKIIQGVFFLIVLLLVQGKREGFLRSSSTMKEVGWNSWNVNNAACTKECTASSPTQGWICKKQTNDQYTVLCSTQQCGRSGLNPYGVDLKYLHCS